MYRYGRLASTLTFALCVIAGCGGTTSTSSSSTVPAANGSSAAATTNQESDVSTPQREDPSTSTSVSTTTEPPAPPDPVVELSAFAQNATFSTGVIDHPCGRIALVDRADHAGLFMWSGSDWVEIESLSSWFTDFDRSVADVRVVDLTSDGLPEVFVEWELESGDMRSVGSVLQTSAGDCAWDWSRLVDSCGDWAAYGSLQVEGPTLTGSGFVGGCSGRGGVKFRWYDDIQRFVARPYDQDDLMCGDYEPNALDLPLLTCQESWAIEMFQYGLTEQGFSVDADGYFGPGSQLAVIAYQQRNRLYPSGVIDGDTWNAMFPVDWDLGYADFDGDGISTPIEIAHYSGADLYLLDDGQWEAAAQATTKSAPYKVGTRCEAKPFAGLVSSVHGQLIKYFFYDVMSDGSERLASMSSSWDNFPRVC